jgi:hypothetical protein
MYGFVKRLCGLIGCSVRHDVEFFANPGRWMRVVLSRGNCIMVPSPGIDCEFWNPNK